MVCQLIPSVEFEPGHFDAWGTMLYTSSIFCLCIVFCISLIAINIAIWLPLVIKVIDFMGMRDHFDGVGNAFRFLLGLLVSHFCATRDTSLRGKFRTRAFTSVVPELPIGHPHPTAAGLRDSASSNIDDFITDSGHTVFSVSMSSRENFVNCRGTRGMYSARDIGQIPRFQYPLDSDVIKMVDVDYYVDFGFYLTLMRPIILFTFVPRDVAGPIFDGAFCTNADNSITTFVSGGTSYTHSLWDHNNDFLCYRGWLHDYFYIVEHRSITGTNWSYILYVPVTRVPRIFSTFLGPSPKLQRRIFKDGNYAIHTYVGDQQAMVSLAHFGSTQSIIIPQVYLQSLLDRFAASPDGFNLGSIDVILRALDHDEQQRAWEAPILYHYVLQHPTLRRPTTSTIDNVNYFPVKKGVELDTTGTMGRQIHPPLLAGGGVPAANVVSEAVAVEERITKLQAESPVNVPDPYPQFTEDFLNYFCKKLTPKTLEEVEAKQNTKAQKMAAKRNLVAFGLGNSNPKSFIKAEAYVVASPPRMITTVTADHRLAMSRYMHAINAHLKTFPWYAFGMSPVKLAERLHCICRILKEVYGTDFGRFDGRHAQLLWNLEYEIMRRCFESPEARERMEMEKEQRGKTKYGIRYATGFSRITGSPTTSGFNSVDNAYICYVALRVDGCSHQEAVDKLGLYGGDDGVTPPLRDPSNLEKVAKAYGADLKVEKFTTWVPFLGRIYLNPFVRTESIYDLRRFVAKAHITVAPKDVPLGLAASRKARGFRVTDSNTPLIAQWCDYIERTYGVSELKDDREMNWWVRGIHKFHLPPFPQTNINDPLVQAVALELVGPSLDHYIQCLTTGNFPPLLDGGGPVKVDVVLGGILYSQLAPPKPIVSNSISVCPAEQISGSALLLPVPVAVVETPTITPKVSLDLLSIDQALANLRVNVPEYPVARRPFIHPSSLSRPTPHDPAHITVSPLVSILTKPTDNAPKSKIWRRKAQVRFEDETKTPASSPSSQS